MIQITNLVDKISQLEISGVRVRDMDQIPAAVNVRDCPMLIPEPLNFIQNIVVVRDAAGAASYAPKTITYTLNYTFLHSPVGDDRALANYADMVKKVFAILDAFILADAIASGTSFDEVIDITPASVTEFGPVPDPAGNQFLGCRMQFLVTEFIN